jgi:hypothetical protein
MKSVHLVIPDLFLPKDFAAEACRGLSLPALEKMLGRGYSETREPAPLENLLCDLFGVKCQPDVPIAPISAAYDGLAAGCWLRADPVHLSLQRDQLLMAGVQVGSEEAAALCAGLNAHFAGQGMEFFAPHPQRWYVRVDVLPQMRTAPLSQVIGGDVRRVLPIGEDASRWHQVFNEIQMLLHAHPLNEAREARGEAIINSVWFWGCGCGENATLQKSHDSMSSDDVLAEMFAKAAGIPFAPWPKLWSDEQCSGKQLLVCTGLRYALQQGDLSGWRIALQQFETGYAQPLWRALTSGKIAQLQLDIPGVENHRHVELKRGDTWAFWRAAKPLARHSIV